MRQLACLKSLLHTFVESTSLRINYKKSHILPINVSREKMSILVNTFDFQIGEMPFTYLGLLIGTTKPCMEDLTPLMDIVKCHLTANDQLHHHPNSDLCLTHPQSTFIGNR